MTYTPDDYYAAAQSAAERHLEQAWAHLHDEDSEEPPNLLAPFCGCLTCEVREVLHAAHDNLRAAWELERSTVAAEDEHDPTQL